MAILLFNPFIVILILVITFHFQDLYLVIILQQNYWFINMVNSLITPQILIILWKVYFCTRNSFLSVLVHVYWSWSLSLSVLVFLKCLVNLACLFIFVFKNDYPFREYNFCPPQPIFRIVKREEIWYLSDYANSGHCEYEFPIPFKHNQWSKVLLYVSGLSSHTYCFCLEQKPILLDYTLPINL